MSLKKVDYINQETIIEAENLNDIQDAIIALEEIGPDAIVNTASGEAIAIYDSGDKKLAGLNIYGKSTQAGTPTPSAPVDIVSVGDDGDVDINVGGERFALTLANGLRGIPVTDKAIATYTDSKGQTWCADEIDLARGVYIQRINRHQFTDDEKRYMVHRESTAGNTFVIGNPSIKIQEPTTNTESPVIISNIASGIAYRSRGDKDYVSVYVGPGATFEIRDSVANTLTLDEMLSKTIVIEYILATPIETPLTAEQIAAYKALHTNKPNTTIINDENAYMTVKYIADPKSYIDNKVASAILAATVE